MEAQDAAPALDVSAVEEKDKSPSPTEVQPLVAEKGHGSPVMSPTHEMTAEEKSEAHKQMVAFEEQKKKAENVDMVSH